MTPASSWAAGIGSQILVRVTTDDGLVGWGECFAYGAPLAVCNVVDDALAPLAPRPRPDADRAPARPHAPRADDLGPARPGHDGGQRRGAGAVGSRRQGARRARLPAARRPRASRALRAYASLLRYDTPAEVGQAVVGDAAAGLHRASSSIRPTSSRSPPPARRSGHDVDIMLDTNCPWTVEEAIRIGRQLERYELRWLEEPVWPPEDYAGLARVRQALRIPIACGENDATVFGVPRDHRRRRRRRRAAQHDQGRRASAR